MNHRKILVIDGQISYTGGINLADEYINHIERFGHWKDSGIRIDGPATQAFTRLFLMNWYINRGEISDFDQYHLEIRHGLVVVFVSHTVVDRNQSTR